MTAPAALRRALAAILVVVALAPLSYGQPDPRTQVRHVGARQALQLYQAGKIILMDVHPGGDDKRRSDIVGAVYVPTTRLAGVKINAPPGVLIGVFCN